MAGISKPNQAEYEAAISAIGGARSAAALIAAFIQSDECDMQRYGFDVGEGLGLIAEILSDSFVTLNNAAVRIEGEGGGQ